MTGHVTGHTGAWFTHNHGISLARIIEHPTLYPEAFKQMIT